MIGMIKQALWCRVYVPDTQELYSSDGSRLWFRVKIEDETGDISLYIREKAALALAALASKEELDEEEDPTGAEASR